MIVVILVKSIAFSYVVGLQFISIDVGVLLALFEKINERMV